MQTSVMACPFTSFFQQCQDMMRQVVLVGCCRHADTREVSYHTARSFADERNIPVIEINGKEGVNVDLAFMTLAGQLVNNLSSNEE